MLCIWHVVLDDEWNVCLSAHTLDTCGANPAILNNSTDTEEGTNTNGSTARLVSHEANGLYLTQHFAHDGEHLQ